MYVCDLTKGGTYEGQAPNEMNMVEVRAGIINHDIDIS